MRTGALLHLGEIETRDGSPFSFERTIDRCLVHNRNISEVLLTRGSSTGQHNYAVSAQWPRRHFHLQKHDYHVDSALVAETLRQATIYVAHEFYGAPLDALFLMGRMMFDRTNLPLSVLDGPWNVELVVQVQDVRKRGRSLASMTSIVSFQVGGTEVATGLGELKLVSRGVYERILGAAAMIDVATPDENPDHRRGLDLIADSTGGQRWVLTPDPAYLEHPSDHVPGMLVMDAVREAGRRYLRDDMAEMVQYDAYYSHFLELGRVELEILDVDREESALRISTSQQGAPGMTASARFRRAD